MRRMLCYDEDIGRSFSYTRDLTTFVLYPQDVRQPILLHTTTDQHCRSVVVWSSKV